jgi:hypothetical protein
MEKQMENILKLASDVDATVKVMNNDSVIIFDEKQLNDYTNNAIKSAMNDKHLVKLTLKQKQVLETLLSNMDAENLFEIYKKVSEKFDSGVYNNSFGFNTFLAREYVSKISQREFMATLLDISYIVDDDVDNKLDN